MTRLIVLGTLAAGLAWADDWDRVQSLHEGDRVGIIRTDKKRVEATFVAATTDTIVLRGDAPMTVAKDDVVRVYKRPKIGRWTRALIGVGIGAAAGGVVDATAGTRFRNEGAGLNTAAAYALGAAIGGAAGGASGGDETIYRRAAPLPK
jgi:hypothetical protein